VEAGAAGWGAEASRRRKVARRWWGRGVAIGMVVVAGRD